MTEQEHNKPILSWDTAEIATRETEHRMAYPEDFSIEEMTEDEVFNDVRAEQASSAGYQVHVVCFQKELVKRFLDGINRINQTTR